MTQDSKDSKTWREIETLKTPRLGDPEDLYCHLETQDKRPKTLYLGDPEDLDLYYCHTRKINRLSKRDSRLSSLRSQVYYSHRRK